MIRRKESKSGHPRISQGSDRSTMRTKTARKSCLKMLNLMKTVDIYLCTTMARENITRWTLWLYFCFWVSAIGITNSTLVYSGVSEQEKSISELYWAESVPCGSFRTSIYKVFTCSKARKRSQSKLSQTLASPTTGFKRCQWVSWWAQGISGRRPWTFTSSSTNLRAAWPTWRREEASSTGLNLSQTKTYGQRSSMAGKCWPCRTFKTRSN